MEPSIFSPWGDDWFWSLPLIGATVVIHIFCLGMIFLRVSLLQTGNGKKSPHYAVSMLVIGGASLLATILHGFEAWMWAATYIFIGALPDRKTAMLYSLGAMTTYGKADINLESRWQLMGPLEALDGWILFGLTTAFLLAILQNIWHTSNRST